MGDVKMSSRQRKGSGRVWCMSEGTRERPWAREARRLKQLRRSNLTCRSQGMPFRKKVVKYNRGNEDREISPPISVSGGFWRRAWQPLLYSCLDNPMVREA